MSRMSGPIRKKRRRMAISKPKTIQQQTFNLAKKAYAISKRNQKQLNSVEKSVSTNYDGGSLFVTSTYNSTSFNLVGQGDSDFARQGNKIAITKLHFRYSLYYDPSGVLHDRVRIIVFAWYNESVPSAADLFLTPSNVLSYMNTNFAKQFKILYNKIHCVDTVINDCITIDKTIDFTKTKEGHHIVTFNGTGSTDFEAGQIYMGFYSTTASSSIQLFHASRIRYTDM